MALKLLLDGGNGTLGQLQQPALPPIQVGGLCAGRRAGPHFAVVHGMDGGKVGLPDLPDRLARPVEQLLQPRILRIGHHRLNHGRSPGLVMGMPNGTLDRPNNGGK
ncbi:hypothetical protein [Nonomuraea aridisoli]|uniref:hypothetical protein n=1 Tax=Nonomuraea aridisoli TaxID=2070368 RepID=UPI0011B94A0B|nr:hypothetical protein [Nonomuraea aridisoli]